MKKVYLLLFLSLFFFKFCSAQTDTTKKNNSERITIFDKANGLTPFQGYTDTSKNHKKWNGFMLNPFLLISGDLPFYYERQITKHSSLEVALGVTFENYILQEGSDGDLEGLIPNFFVDDNTIWKTGVSLKAAYKLYPGYDEMMDGFYISPEIAYRENGLQTPYLDANSVPTNVFYQGRYSYTDLKFLLGYEGTIFNSDNAMAEFYSGIGLRFYNVSTLEHDDDASTETNTPVTITDIKPHFYLGFRFGFKIR